MTTLTSPREIDALFRAGRSAADRLLVVIVAPTPAGREPEGRLLFVAGGKVGPAVVRNRCKRVLREAARRAGGPWAGVDVALVARRGLESAAPAAIDKALSSALSRVDVAR
ncbi:MAG: ribonuclease P protein component [Coriobacteriia bacterium]